MATNQLSIEGGIDFQRIELFGQLNLQLKRCSTRFTVIHIELFQYIHYIFRLRKEDTIMHLQNLNSQIEM